MFQFLKLGPKVLKGTRIAKFFNFHKAKAVEEVVETSAKAKLLVSGSKTPLMKIDFIQHDGKVLHMINENPVLNNAVAKYQKNFTDIFPDKQALDELEVYLSLTSKKEADELAEVLHILGEDKYKMTPEQYKDVIEDLKKAIKNSCDI